MIYRVVPAALMLALCAALVSAAHAATRTSCVDQTIMRMQTQTVVGSGRLCSNGRALSLNAKVTLPKGAWTVYFKSLWDADRTRVSTSALHTLHVQGGTSVFLYDRVPLPTTARTSEPISETTIVVKGAKGCAVLPQTITGAALAPNCPTWATTTSGTILLPR